MSAKYLGVNNKLTWKEHTYIQKNELNTWASKKELILCSKKSKSSSTLHLLYQLNPVAQRSSLGSTAEISELANGKIEPYNPLMIEKTKRLVVNSRQRLEEKITKSSLFQRH